METKTNQHDTDGFLLSIVIPTKNRQQYCFKAIKHIIGLNLKAVEIIIQDNSDSPILEKDLEDANFKGLVKYHYNPAILSFVDNFSEAISLCTGKYICMIGDDDSVLPNIVEVANYAYINDIDAIVPPLQVYHWPCENPLKPSWKRGFLATLKFHGSKYKLIDVNKRLIQLIYNYFQDYQQIGVPRIYHGLVKKECIESVKEICGVYFSGLTPDMFMSTALCFTIKKAFSYSLPITISGICPKSGSADSATGRHTGELKDAPHFRGHKKYKWVEYVPYIYTVETIWAESGIQALRLMHKSEYEKYFNIRNFILYLAVKFPQFKPRLLSLGFQYGLTSKEFNHFQKSYSRKLLFTKIYTLIKKGLTLNFARKFYQVESIEAACTILNKVYGINKNQNNHVNLQR